MEPASPALLICGFGPFPAAPANPAGRVIEALRARDWSPQGARAAYAVLPTLWAGAVEELGAAMAACDCTGVLLVGVAVKARGFRVELRARNRAAPARADAAGLMLGRDRVDLAGSSFVRVTAPVAEMFAALCAEGLPAAPSSDAGAYLCNYTLYRALTDVAGRPDAPTIGFLHVPAARELAGPAAAFTLEQIERGVRAAAQAFADALSGARAPSLPREA